MILIVDDKPENTFSLKRTLELNGFIVDTAHSGEETLKKILKNDDYSLVILDVQMPGMDGFEVAEAISGYSKAKDIPIIFLSAVNTDKKFIAKGYTSGAVDYIVKPVDTDVLLLKVKTLHRLYEQNRELNKIHVALKKEVEERKKAEEELNIRVEELHSILEAIPQIAFTLKPTGETEFVNEYWYLYSNEAGRFPQFHDDDKEVTKKLQDSITYSKPLICEVRIWHIANNEYRYHLLKMLPIRQRSTVVKWVGTFTDIHEQKKANEILEHKVSERTEELIEKNKELESSNYELQQFAYVASHDLKEPLRKVQIFSTILKDKYGADDEMLSDTLTRIVKSSNRMNNLINDLLDYSRLSKELLFKPVNINEVIDEILPDLELVLHEKQAIVDISKIPVIDAIPGQMRQVFQNLLSNSLKFARKDVPPVININAEVIQEPEMGASARITFTDNGIGLNEQFGEKIFTIFQRLHGKEEYEGNGIGLAIVKKIIEKHGGTITVSSKEDEGATFTIILPLHQTKTS